MINCPGRAMCKCTISNRSGAHQYEGERWQRIEFCSMHAAAPALLKALEYCMDLIVFLRTPDHPAVTTAFDKARAAIAQANGEGT